MRGTNFLQISEEIPDVVGEPFFGTVQMALQSARKDLLSMAAPPQLCLAEGAFHEQHEGDIWRSEFEPKPLLREREEGPRESLGMLPKETPEKQAPARGGRLKILKKLTDEKSVLRNNQASRSLSAASIGAAVSQLLQTIAKMAPELMPSVLFLAVCSVLTGFVLMKLSGKLSKSDAENLGLNDEQALKCKQQWRRLGSMMASLGTGALVPEFFGPMVTSLFSAAGIGSAVIAGALYHIWVVAVQKMAHRLDKAGAFLSKVGNIFKGSKSPEAVEIPEEAPPALKILIDSKGDANVVISEEAPTPPSVPEKTKHKK